MLLELRVKNLALIEEVHLEFYAGLTVLSGETGAGKSILIDSINLALGAKATKDIIRTGAEYAYVELLFSIDDRSKLKTIRDMGIEVGEDELITISRKISAQKSVVRVNSEIVALSRLRLIMALLIDIHSQHESQSLLEVSKHLELIDLFAGKEIEAIKKEIHKEYQLYHKIMHKLSETIDDSARKREIEFLRYEIEEIEQADLKVSEEEELLQRYAKRKNASKIADAMSRISNCIEEDTISQAVRGIASIVQYDDELVDIESQLRDIENLLSELRHNVYDYIDDLDFDEREFDEISSRLDIVRKLKSKYAESIEEIWNICEKKKERLAFLEDYEVQIAALHSKKSKQEELLGILSDKLSGLRKETAQILKGHIIRELQELNFLGVDFDISFKKLGNFTAEGRDFAEFMISTNPGNPKKALKDVASGGELSRIMLAIKTVFADVDEVDTLIFDEIDTGISGRTAQKVSEKLMLIGRAHQVLCITHLPQIAAMADHNYVIEKHTDGQSTKTDISYVREEKLIAEIARLIGGSEITRAVLDTAGEMKELANKLKG